MDIARSPAHLAVPDVSAHLEMKPVEGNDIDSDWTRRSIFEEQQCYKQGAGCPAIFPLRPLLGRRCIVAVPDESADLDLKLVEENDAGRVVQSTYAGAIYAVASDSRPGVMPSSAGARCYLRWHVCTRWG